MKEDNASSTVLSETAYQVRLPLFEGPLDLLLHLIEQEELDITRVALAQVTDQYLEYLAMLKQVEVENLTDFLVVAAKLVLIKSQALLPKPPPSLAEQEQEEDLGDQLARQLRLYKRFRGVAELLSDRELAHLRAYVRVAPPPKIEPKLSLGDVTLDDLLLAVREALSIRPKNPHVDEVVSPVTVTIVQQIDLIKRNLLRGQTVYFRRLLHTASSRLEVIITFMAILELIKQKLVDVRQEHEFGDIAVFSVSRHTPDSDTGAAE